ncbi:hypothetical protein VNO78_27296 [Psophocarpus tetragonolobus]|uniref:Uncharacterized protein n=1 Tax=Psophocarpus tetragonolobus TaxID=3891 RepID=A0AAN9S1H8_PSOTE
MSIPVELPRMSTLLAVRTRGSLAISSTSRRSETNARSKRLERMMNMSSMRPNLGVSQFGLKTVSLCGFNGWEREGVLWEKADRGKEEKDGD